MTNQNNRRDPKNLNIDEEMKFCAEVGQELFEQ